MIKNEYSDLALPKDKLYGIYRGVVENNNSPDKDGKCQIRVFGVHCSEKIKTPTTGIPTEELPWAEPATPIFGGVSKIGIFGVPLQGSHVFLFFENGNPMNPRYFATAPGIPFIKPNGDKGFNDPDEEYPLMEHLFQPDWNKGENSTSEYPNNFVIKAPCGHIIEMDSTEDNERIVIKHGITGATIEFTKEGSIVITSKGNTNKEYSGAKSAVISGDYSVKVTEAHSLSVKDLSLNVAGSSKELVTGSKTMTCLAKSSQKAEEIEINSTGDNSSIAGEKSALIAGKKITISSKEDSIDIKAPLNINIKALISSKMEGVVTADVKGMITTIEGTATADVKGLLTTITGNAVTQIKGGIIMIG